MIKEVFHKAKLRLTRPRLLVFQILQKNHQPQSARQIHKKLGRKIDLASVYRNLLTFERLGIVQREYALSEDYFYLSKHKHHHITCVVCGLSQCVPCKHSFTLKNFQNIKHEVILRGVCLRCA